MHKRPYKSVMYKRIYKSVAPFQISQASGMSPAAARRSTRRHLSSRPLAARISWISQAPAPYGFGPHTGVGPTYSGTVRASASVQTSVQRLYERLYERLYTSVLPFHLSQSSRMSPAAAQRATQYYLPPFPSYSPHGHSQC